MSGERLEDLIVSAAEKDLTDTIDLGVVVKAWASKEKQKTEDQICAVTKPHGHDSPSVTVYFFTEIVV